MFGRRSHARFSITPASEGTLRVLRDVVLQPSSGGEIIAISREAGVVGEQLIVEVPGSDQVPASDKAEGASDSTMRITESRPIVVDGAVRHRLRLQRASSLR